jgi:hypothetical protein
LVIELGKRNKRIQELEEDVTRLKGVIETQNEALIQMDEQLHGANRVNQSKEEFIKEHQDRVKRDVAVFRDKLKDE